MEMNMKIFWSYGWTKSLNNILFIFDSANQYKINKRNLIIIIITYFKYIFILYFGILKPLLSPEIYIQIWIL